MTLRPRLRALVVALLVPACASDPPCGLQLCDIRDAACQRVTAEATACLRGVEPVMVPVVVVSRDDFVANATATTLTPAEEETFRRWNAGLAALELAPVDNSPGAASAARAAQIGGFYSSQDKQITIIEDGRPLDGWPFVALLVHEYVHAIQDARLDLAQLHATHDTDLDRALGAGAVIEGDAQYIGDLAAAGFFGISGGDVPWAQVFTRWQDWARGQARSVPMPVTLSWMHFRYPFGSAFTKAALDASGWTGVDALFGAVPSGTREVMAGFGATAPDGVAWAEDLGADAVPILDARFEYVAAERMGAWLFEAFLARTGSLAYADALPRRLRGDVLAVFHHQPTDGAVAFWRFRFGSGTDADLGVPADFALDQVARLLPAARSRSLGSSDVVIVAASSAATLSAAPNTVQYQSIPPAAPATAPLAAGFGRGCVEPAR